jgi:hypothetical protein
MSEFLFKASNHHTASCGPPPTVDGDAPDAYYGYFANEHGEQALYVYDECVPVKKIVSEVDSL